MNVAQVAEKLGLSRSAVYELAASEVLASYRVGPKGGSLRFAVGDVEAYLRQCRANVTVKTAAAVLARRRGKRQVNGGLKLLRAAGYRG